MKKSVGLPGKSLETNEGAAAFVSADSNCIGFMSVDPNQIDWVDEIDNSIGLVLVEIKLGANYRILFPLGHQALELYAPAQKLSLPINFHTGASLVREAPLMYSHATVTNEVALRFPE